MSHSLLAPLAALAVLAPLGSAESYNQHSFNFGAGGGVPGDQLKPYFSQSAVFHVGYGYRPHRNFQVDAGLDTLLGSARVRDYLTTGFGDLRIRDFQYLLPVGGRVILPFADGRAQISAGGGDAYMWYREQLRQPGDYIRVECPPCRGRSGPGYYALAGFRVALDRNRQIWLGGTTRVVRGRTNGDSLGSLPAIRSRDLWVNSFIEVGFSF
ncbi:MAG: hypothetical protein FJW40_14235 [Acidobacteria bacterium]|nr:hypothetical protein [Acidobacteriota bacterium]